MEADLHGIPSRPGVLRGASGARGRLAAGGLAIPGVLDGDAAAEHGELRGGGGEVEGLLEAAHPLARRAMGRLGKFFFLFFFFFFRSILPGFVYPPWQFRRSL